MKAWAPLIGVVFLCGALTAPEVAFAKPKKKKEESNPPVTMDSRLKEWNASEAASRGDAAHLCEKDYQELALIERFFKDMNASFPPVPDQKKTLFAKQLTNHAQELSDEINDDPDFHQFKLQQKIQNLEGLLSHYSGSAGWARQEKILNTYLVHMRGSAPYTVSQQAEPFDALNDLIKIKRAMESVFTEMERTHEEWNRLIAFDRLEKLGVQDSEHYSRIKSAFLTGSIDPVMACHLDYLSHF